MNNTIKLLFFNILLCSAPALQARGSVRSFGARAFKTAVETATKFKLHAHAFKAQKFTANKQLLKPSNFNGSDNGKQGYTNFKKAAAIMPLIKMGTLYGICDQLKEWLGYGEVEFTIDAIRAESWVGHYNYQKNVEKYKNYIIKNWDKLFNNKENDTQNIAVFIELLQQGGSNISFHRDFQKKLCEKLLTTNIEVYKAIYEHSQDNFRYYLIVSLRQHLTALIEKNPEAIFKFTYHNGNWDLIEHIYPYRKQSPIYPYEVTQDEDIFIETIGLALQKCNTSASVPYFSFVDVALDPQNKIPLWHYHRVYDVVSQQNHKNIMNTQTDAHGMQNIRSVVPLLKDCPQQLRQVLKQAYEKEKEERKKGNYVFYHGQQWGLHYYADIYKQLWNVVKNDEVKEDFVFTRFNEQNEAPNERNDALFFNHALFGNSQKHGSCSYSYFNEGRSIYSPKISLQEMFKNHSLGSYYEKYQKNFEELQQLHKEANKNGHGNLLMVSVKPEEIKHIKPINCYMYQENKKDLDKVENAKTALDLLFDNPKALPTTDVIEYIMPLTTEYALNPKKGPRFYSFNVADPEKLKKYVTKRNELFNKILVEVESEKFLHNINIL